MVRIIADGRIGKLKLETFLDTGKALLALSGVLVLAVPAHADGPFTTGNIVLTQVVGDDNATPTTTLSSKGTRLRLVEYQFNNSGVLVATGKFYNLPGLATDPEKNSTAGNNFLAPSGTATSEARPTLSADGRFLIVTGYNATIGTTGVVGTRSAATARVIGRVNWRLLTANGAIDTTTALTDAYDSNNIRSAASLDGTGFYTAGTNLASVDTTGATGGLRFAPLGATTSTQIENNPVNGGSDNTTALLNIRAVFMANGRVHLVSGSAQLDGSATFNPGLPTTRATAVTEVNTLSTSIVFTNTQQPTGGGANTSFTSFPSPYDIYFADPNTAYTADSRGFDFTAVPTAPTMANPTGNAPFYTQQSTRQYVGQNAADGPNASGTQFFRQSGGGIYRFRRNPITGVWNTKADAHFNVFAVNPANGAQITTQVNENADGSPNATLQTQNAYVGVYGLTGARNAAGNVVLYGVTADNRVIQIVDTGSTQTFTQLLSLGSNGAATGGVPAASVRGLAFLHPVTADTLNITGLATAGVGNDGVAPTVTFDYRTPGTLNVIKSLTDVPYPDGRIFINDSPAGTYNVGIKGFNTLRTTLSNIVLTNGNATLPAVTLFPGDVNADNSVDLTDINLASTSFGSVAGAFLVGGGDATFNLAADVNYDGQNDLTDLNLISSQFGNVGDD